MEAALYHALVRLGTACLAIASKHCMTAGGVRGPMAKGRGHQNMLGGGVRPSQLYYHVGRLKHALTCKKRAQQRTVFNACSSRNHCSGPPPLQPASFPSLPRSQLYAAVPPHPMPTHTCTHVAHAHASLAPHTPNRPTVPTSNHTPTTPTDHPHRATSPPDPQHPQEDD